MAAGCLKLAGFYASVVCGVEPLPVFDAIVGADGRTTSGRLAVQQGQSFHVVVQREERSGGSGTPFEAKFTINGEHALNALSVKGRRIRVPHKKQDRAREVSTRHFMFAGDDEDNSGSQGPVKEQSIQITIRLKKNVRPCNIRNSSSSIPSYESEYLNNNDSDCYQLTFYYVAYEQVHEPAFDPSVMDYTSPLRETTGTPNERRTAHEVDMQQDNGLQEPLEDSDDAHNSPGIDQESHGRAEVDPIDPRLTDDRYEYEDRGRDDHGEDDDEEGEVEEDDYDDEDRMDTDTTAWDQTHDPSTCSSNSKADGATHTSSSFYATPATIGFGDYPVPTPPRSIAGDPEAELMRTGHMRKKLRLEAALITGRHELQRNLLREQQVFMAADPNEPGHLERSIEVSSHMQILKIRQLQELEEHKRASLYFEQTSQMQMLADRRKLERRQIRVKREPVEHVIPEMAASPARYQSP